MNKLSEEAQSLLAFFIGISLLLLIFFGSLTTKEIYLSKLDREMFSNSYAASLECRQTLSAAHANLDSRSVDYGEVCGQVPVYVGVER